MKRKLLLAMVALLSVVCVRHAKAYTVSDLVSDGWTKITSISQTDISNNFYVFLSQDETLILGLQDGASQGNRAMYYQTFADPAADLSKVWYLESNGSNYAIRNADYTYLQLQTEWSGSSNDVRWRTNDQATSISWTGLGLAYDDGWTLTSTQYGRPLGIYNNAAGNPESGNEIGANDTDKGQKFQIYSMSKLDFATKYGSAATSAVPVEMTPLIIDADFNVTRGPAGWTYPAITGGNFNLNGAVEQYHYVPAFDMYQILSVPNGKYRATLQASTNTASACLYANSVSTAIAVDAIDGNFAGKHAAIDADATAGLIGVDVYVTDKTLRLGIKDDNSASTWTVFDNFTLKYYGPTIAGTAVALPAGGDMVAGTWYYIDIAAAADNYNATATPLGDIVYTTEGTILIENAASVTAAFTATDNSLSATRYYVKSSSANNLVVVPASYSYEISSATADVSYIQAGNTVTVSYVVSSNDPGASLSQDYSSVTFGGSAITVTPTVSGFTFTVPEVTAATDYTLAIPAGAIKYNEDHKNDAQEITLRTPAVFDGVYYFYNTYNNAYMSRGSTWGTQAIVDKYGLPAFLEFDGEGKTRVKFFDNYKFLSDGGWLYADNATGGTFYCAKVTGGYKFKDATSEKYVAVYDNYLVGDAVEGVNLVGTSNVWALETPAEYKTKDNATTLANLQAATAATAAGLSGITTLAALESELSTNYGETAIAITGAKAEKYGKNASGDGDNSGELIENEYVKEIVSDLQPGLYRLTVDAFQRGSSNDRVSAAGGANGLVYVYAGTAKTLVKSVMDYGANAAYAADFEYGGKHYPNDESSAYTALETGEYQNTVYVYVADEGSGTGSLTIGINNPMNTGISTYPNAPWTVYNNFTLTYYEALATDAEKTALADAISDAETDYPLGFEDGEYAPYNNIAAATALAAAKAIDPATASGTAVVAATTALTSATWTPNSGEQNAIYNPNFALSENDGDMAGWQNSNTAAGLGGAYHSRAFVLTTGTNYDYLAVFGQGNGTRSAGYFRFDGTNSGKDAVYTYGATAGYTLPLKEKVYEIKATVGGWGQVDKDIKLAIVNSSNTEVASQTKHTPNTGVHAGGSVVDFDFLVAIPAEADYKIQLKNANTSVDNAIVISNFSLLSVPDVEVAVTAAGYATYSNSAYPLDLANISGGTAYIVATAASGDYINLAEQATAVPANTGLLIATTSGDAGTVTIPVAASGEAPTDNYLVATDGTDVAAGNYVFAYETANPAATAGFYKLGDATAVAAGKAYLDGTAVPSLAKVLRFVFGDGTATGIDGVSGDNGISGDDGEAIYNVAGQQVDKDYKGIVIKNGKKYLQK